MSGDNFWGSIISPTSRVDPGVSVMMVGRKSTYKIQYKTYQRKVRIFRNDQKMNLLSTFRMKK